MFNKITMNVSSSLKNSIIFKAKEFRVNLFLMKNVLKTKISMNLTYSMYLIVSTILAIIT